MSRVVGLHYRDGAGGRRSLVEQMLSACDPVAGWGRRVEDVGGAALGSMGRPLALAAAGGVVIVLDGHIYNATDFDFDGGDAGVVAGLYARHGFEGALNRLNGDFAIGLYDSREDTLWLARDRLGVKPLYYVEAPGRFAFASRPKALVSLPWVEPRINRRFCAVFAGAHYRYFDNHPDETAYEGLSQVPPGHVLRLSQAGARRTPYWSMSELPEIGGALPELAARYRDLLADAVSLRLKTAPTPAFTLSGGMDSSSVVASALQTVNGRTSAFSTVYDDKTYDESGDIRPMVEATGLEWRPVAVDSPDVFSLVDQMIRIHDEPVATATWLSHYLLCREVRHQGFDSLFGGLGGDELNAGEYEYFLYHFADLRLAGCDNAEWRDEIEGWIEHHDHPVFRKSTRVVEEGLATLVDLAVPGRCLPDRKRLRRYYAAVDRDFFDLETFEPRMDHPFDSYLKNRTSQDLFRETLPCCLRAEDRHATAHGLDHYLPFLDYRLVEFMFRVPGTLKIRRGVTKQLLREAMKGILPEATRMRVKKTGWNAPAHVWFSGSGLDAVRDLVASQDFRQRGIYDVRQVQRLVDEHETIVASGRAAENHMMFIWQLVNLELWLRTIDEA